MKSLSGYSAYIVGLICVVCCVACTNPGRGTTLPSEEDGPSQGNEVPDAVSGGGNGGFDPLQCDDLGREDCTRAPVCVSEVDASGVWLGCAPASAMNERAEVCYWDEECALNERCVFVELSEDLWDDCFCEPCSPGEECPPCDCNPSGEGFCTPDPNAVSCTDDTMCPEGTQCVVDDDDDCACPPCVGESCAEECVCEDVGAWCIASAVLGECVRDDDCAIGSFCVQGDVCSGEEGCEEIRFCEEAQCIDDGSALSCNIPRPTCESGYIAVVREGCYACVDARTCGVNTACAGSFIGSDGMCRGARGESVPASCCDGGSVAIPAEASGLAQEECSERGLDVLRLDLRDPRRHTQTRSCGEFGQGSRISVSLDLVNGRRQDGSVIWSSNVETDPMQPNGGGVEALLCEGGICSEIGEGELTFAFSPDNAYVSGILVFWSVGDVISLPFQAQLCTFQSDFDGCL